MIQFKNDTELEIVEAYDEKTDCIIGKSTEIFKKGEYIDADIYSENGQFVNLEFGDGSVSLGVQRSCFDVVEVESIANLSRKLKADTSHWTGQAWNRGERLKD